MNLDLFSHPLVLFLVVRMPVLRPVKKYVIKSKQ